MVRDADELHDALLTLIILPPVEEWRGYYDELARAGRASTVGGHWVATERLDRADDVLAILRGWADSIGPFTAAALAERLGLPLSDVEIALAQLEGEGSDSAREFHAAGITSFVIGAFWRAFTGRRWDGCGARSSR